MNLNNRNLMTNEYVLTFEIVKQLKSNITFKWDNQKYSKYTRVNAPKWSQKDSTLFAC